MNGIFFIPDRSKRDTNITQNDIRNGYLRIGVSNKIYFPSKDCDIIVVIEGSEYRIKFRTRDGDGKSRSYSLQLGKELMEKLGVNPHTTIECQKIADNKYSFSK